MSWMSRYREGEFEAVWNEIVTEGPELREDGSRSAEAAQVASELMLRVKRNVERICQTLGGLGYQFEAEEPITAPQANSDAVLVEIEATVGPVPLSLKAWLDEVGGVNLNGTHPDWTFEYADALVVECDLGGVVEDYNYRQESGWFATAGTHKLPLYLAPDYLHKAQVSGGEPYGIELPEAAADTMWRNDDLHEGATFVAYLRSAILDWAGFPGWARTEPDFARPSQPFPDELRRLASGLEPF